MSDGIYPCLDTIYSSVGHYTKVILKNEKEYEGYLYTIDPETKHVVLYKEKNIKIIFHSTIQQMTCK